MPKRDSIATKARLLKSGLVEFGNNGFSGARTEKIAKRARCNVRLSKKILNQLQKFHLVK